ncbi:MAG: CHRD domain-containing protein [Gammaproteobacteria bacterium]
MNARLLAAMSSSLILLACGGGYGGGGSGGGGPGGGYGGPDDVTAPTVTLSAPAIANRTTMLTANATDNVGVTTVEFRLDGTVLGRVTTTPYTFTWDTSAAADGTHVLTAVAGDAAGNTTTSAAVNVEVRNQQQFALALTEAQENPPTGSQATGSGTIDVNLLTGATTGAITITGFSVTAAHIHDGFAGINGPILIGLQQDPANPQRWQVSANAMLTAAQIDRLMTGALYVNAHSAQFPGGEIRAQLAPANVKVIFTALTGQEEVPPATTTASARAATTVDTTIRTVTIHVNTTNLDTADAAHIHTGAAGVSGPILIGLTRDAVTPSLWSAVAASVTEAQLQDFNANRWYVNVHTPANPDGEVRGQIIAPQN